MAPNWFSISKRASVGSYFVVFLFCLRHEHAGIRRRLRVALDRWEMLKATPATRRGALTCRAPGTSAFIASLANVRTGS